MRSAVCSLLLSNAMSRCDGLNKQTSNETSILLFVYSDLGKSLLLRL